MTPKPVSRDAANYVNFCFDTSMPRGPVWMPFRSLSETFGPALRPASFAT
jgi:hypothetical protein